ncbi:cyclase family protein [Gordonia terrae]|uniref:cyclase family protein n=1 Tax=Gordonia terrae TaxID=2055 RepID=UPI003F6C8B66
MTSDMHQSLDSDLVSLFGVATRVVDLSQRLSNSTSAHETMPHTIEYFEHEQTAESVSPALGLRPEHWSHRQAWAWERVTLTTHSGTHIDAPYHYGPVDDAGHRPRTIDEVPFSWVIGNGVVLDMRECTRDDGITAADIEAGLQRIDYSIRPLDIVLIRTDVSLHYGEPGYDLLHPGLRRDATAYLVERGVRLIGIDAWGLDRPMDVMAAQALAGDTDQLWESHKYGVSHQYSQIEKLCNLNLLPAKGHGFHVLALPVCLERASGAWSRVVALVPEV